jgi:hypothetical protein
MGSKGGPHSLELGCGPVSLPVRSGAWTGACGRSDIGLLLVGLSQGEASSSAQRGQVRAQIFRSSCSGAVRRQRRLQIGESPADNVTVSQRDAQGVVTVAALRALPPPAVPPPGPLDGVIGLLLARAAPFDRATQAALCRQQGWGPDAPEPIPEVRSSGRWLATPSLGRLTGV